MVPGSIEKDEAMTTKKSSKKQTSNSTEQRSAKRKKIVSLAEYEAEAAKKPAPGGAGAKVGGKPPQNATTPKKRPTGERGVKGAKRVSGLDLAAKVLAAAGRPMNAKEICEGVIAAGWKTNGKTPAATLYAAIVTEISKKGDKSRFHKADRGLFELVK
jgi:hypothetical protein